MVEQCLKSFSFLLSSSWIVLWEFPLSSFLGNLNAFSYSFEVCLQPLLFPYKVLALGKAKSSYGWVYMVLTLLCLGDLEGGGVIQGLCAVWVCDSLLGPMESSFPHLRCCQVSKTYGLPGKYRPSTKGLPLVCWSIILHVKGPCGFSDKHVGSWVALPEELTAAHPGCLQQPPALVQLTILSQVWREWLHGLVVGTVAT